MQTNYPSATDSWIIGNIEQYGVYRVNYDVGNWENLIKQLNKDHKVNNTIFISVRFAFMSDKDILSKRDNGFKHIQKNTDAVFSGILFKYDIS